VLDKGLTQSAVNGQGVDNEDDMQKGNDYSEVQTFIRVFYATSHSTRVKLD